MDEAERFEPASVQEWSDWLAANHQRARGVWLVTPRRGADRVTVDYESAVVEALRFGWIDSTTKVLDEQRAMMWFARRRPGSGWAASNKRRIARLRAEGRLAPAGEESVRAAMDDGSWTILDDVERLVVPDDLAAALDRRGVTRDRWEAASPSSRRQALWWIVQAKRAETRARRIAAVADRASRGEPLAP